jgi:hypothetical protein
MNQNMGIASPGSLREELLLKIKDVDFDVLADEFNWLSFSSGSDLQVIIGCRCELMQISYTEIAVMQVAKDGPG